MPFDTRSLKTDKINPSTSFSFPFPTPSKPATNAICFCSVSIKVIADGAFPSSVLSRAFRNGEEELSSKIFSNKQASK